MPRLVQKCKGFPRWTLTESGVLSPGLKGDVTSQRDGLREEHASCSVLSLAFLAALLNLVLPGVLSAILYSCPPLQERKELFYFPIKPSRKRSKTIHWFEKLERGQRERIS